MLIIAYVNSNSLVMIIASDVTTLQQRGKYNGFIGSMVALGNGLGPLIGGALTEKASWKWTFWFIVPLIVAVMVALILVLPPSRVTGNTWAKIRIIDWAGIAINMAAVLLVLVSCVSCTEPAVFDAQNIFVNYVNTCRYRSRRAVQLSHGTVV